MAKRIISLLTAAVMLLSFAACSRGRQADGESVLTVSGAEVDTGLFAYYLDKAASVPLKYSLSEDAGADELCAAAEKLCIRHIAVNTLFARCEMKLTNARKLEISEKVNDLWVCFGEHYKKLGIDRSVISRAVTNSVYEDALCEGLFNSGNPDAFEAALKARFAEDYIYFRAVCGAFVTTDAAGSDIAMTPAQTAQLKKAYETAAASVTSPEDIEKAAVTLGAQGSAPVLLKKGQGGYPDGFFEKTAAVKNDSAAVLSFDDCVFLVWRYDISQREEEYTEHRSECVKALCGEALQSALDAEQSGFSVTRNAPALERFKQNIKIYG